MSTRRSCAIALMLAITIPVTACSGDRGSGGPSLPVDEPTGNATQVVTVAAPSLASTTAILQAWARHGKKWVKHGKPAVAHLGRGGLTTHERESLDQSPVGSFTLTQAFGRLANPGTTLPYFRTTPNDWWVSEEGPYYNSHVRCRLKCPFVKGSPNAQLFYTIPQYDLAVVIDYNRSPARPGLGSGIFLHVTRGIPTAGCVSIPSGSLRAVMTWLRPADHPRILIGTDQT